MAERFVISWFGYDIADYGLIHDSDLNEWFVSLRNLTERMDFRIERAGNLIDLIIGHPIRSITLREFYLFQRRWNRLNEFYKLKMSGGLVLQNALDGTTSDQSTEMYRLGRVVFGDSIGRPHRHSLEAIRGMRKRRKLIKSIKETM